MRKVVLFVEGQAEQIFIREMLLRRYVYDAKIVCIRCLQLIAEQLKFAEFDFPDLYQSNRCPSFNSFIDDLAIMG